MYRYERPLKGPKSNLNMGCMLNMLNACLDVKILKIMAWGTKEHHFASVFEYRIKLLTNSKVYEIELWPNSEYRLWITDLELIAKHETHGCPHATIIKPLTINTPSLITVSFLLASLNLQNVKSPLWKQSSSTYIINWAIIDSYTPSLTLDIWRFSFFSFWKSNQPTNYHMSVGEASKYQTRSNRHHKDRQKIRIKHPTRYSPPKIFSPLA